MTKTLQKVGIEGTYLNLIKTMYKKPTANIILNAEKLKPLPIRSGTRHGCPLSPLLFNIVLEVLATQSEKKKKGRKGSGIGGKEGPFRTNLYVRCSSIIGSFLFPFLSLFFFFLATPSGLQDLSSQLGPGIEPMPPAVETRSPNHQGFP